MLLCRRNWRLTSSIWSCRICSMRSLILRKRWTNVFSSSESKLRYFNFFDGDWRLRSAFVAVETERWCLSERTLVYWFHVTAGTWYTAVDCRRPSLSCCRCPHLEWPATPCHVHIISACIPNPKPSEGAPFPTFRSVTFAQCLWSDSYHYKHSDC